MKIRALAGETIRGRESVRKPRAATVRSAMSGFAQDDGRVHMSYLDKTALRVVGMTALTPGNARAFSVLIDTIRA
jgi:hypothetical protein